MTEKRNSNNVNPKNPSLITSLLMTVLIAAVVFIFVFKYSLIYEASTKGDWGTVAVLQLPEVLSTLSASSSMSLA